MIKEFEKGRQYERIDSSKFCNLFLGWACVIMAPVWFFFAVWDFTQRLLGAILLGVFGVFSLYLGYNLRKELKTKKWKQTKE